MKQILVGIIASIIIICAYMYLPMQWRRHKDIKLGDHIITQIEQYHTNHGKLPDPNDESLLKTFGFRKHKEHGWQPTYRLHNNEQFTIVYANGYVKPWLTWDSKQRVWYLDETPP